MPERIAFESLPTSSPPSILHADIVVVEEEFVFGEVVDVDNFLTNQNDVLERVGFDWDDVLVLEKN